MWIILNLFGLRRIEIRISLRSMVSDDFLCPSLFVSLEEQEYLTKYIHCITWVLVVGDQGRLRIPRGFCSQYTSCHLGRTPERVRGCPNSEKLSPANLPNFIEEIVILVSDTIADVLTGLAVVFEDDGNVHVDNDQEAHDQVGNEVGNSSSEIATITIFPDFRVGLFAVGEIKDGGQCSVPSGRGGHLEEEDERLEEGLEVVDIVESGSDLGVLEETDAKDGEDEHDEEEEEADVHQGGEGHDQGEEQGPDSFCSLDQSKNSSNLDERVKIVILLF